MADNFKVKWDKQRGGWCVKGWFNGKRYYYARYLGIPCGFDKNNICRVAMQLSSDINGEINRGLFNPEKYKQSRPLHFQQYVKKWLAYQKARMRQGDLAPATYSEYKGLLKNHILPVIGNEYIGDINREKIDNLLITVKRNQSGKKKVLDTLKTVLRYAHTSGHIAQLPPFPRVKVPKPKIRWLTQDIQWKIIDEIDLADRPIFIFMMLTGCRPSEARALRKSDIKENHIVFASTFGKGEKGEILKNVKGTHEEPFPMTESLKQLFSDMPANLSPFVFLSSKTGRPYSKNINRDYWNHACRKAGINPKDAPLYSSTRHSAACRWLNSGIDKAVVQRLLRHTDSRMTDRYAEYLTDGLKLQLDNVEQLPGRKNHGT